MQDGYQTSDVWYAWNDRNDNTSAIFVNKAVELPQFELVGVDKTSVINQYNIGNYARESGLNYSLILKASKINESHLPITKERVSRMLYRRWVSVWEHYYIRQQVAIPSVL